ncbi:MAG: methyl-accepting chemotaxis protein [Nitrospirae bacterium]|jgi:methyl-accepting chemotaxis protein|nr:methyl-accepting chemotaxis protein [Nitrospirota bacterium]
MKRTWRRRNYFIKKDLQGKYMFSFFVFVIAGSIIFTLIFSLLSSDTLTIVYEDYNLKIGKTPIMLLKEILSAHWIFIVVGGLAVVILSMFLTHRFAGPIFRFERSIDEITNGNLNFQIKLREKDEGKELANKINKMILMFSDNFKEMEKISEEIRNELNSIQEDLKDSRQNENTIHKIDSAIKLNRKLYDILHKFSVKENK